MSTEQFQGLLRQPGLGAGDLAVPMVHPWHVDLDPNLGVVGNNVVDVVNLQKTSSYLFQIVDLPYLVRGPVVIHSGGLVTLSGEGEGGMLLVPVGDIPVSEENLVHSLQNPTFRYFVPT